MMLRARLVRAVLVLAGVVHLVPATAALSRQRLERRYGVAIDDPNVEVLLRHRALLFGVIGSALLAGAMLAPLRRLAAVAGAVSTAGFVVAAGASGATLTDELRTVERIDVALVGAAFAAPTPKR